MGGESSDLCAPSPQGILRHSAVGEPLLEPVSGGHQHSSIVKIKNFRSTLEESIGVERGRGQRRDWEALKVLGLWAQMGGGVQP